MEAAVVGAVAGAVMNNIVAKVLAVLAKRFSELGALAGDIASLKTDLLLIASTIDDEQKGQPITGLQHISMTVMRDLAFEVEDCLDKFLPCAACGGGAAAIPNVDAFGIQVRDLKRRLKEAHDQIDGARSRQQPPGVNGQPVGTEDVPILVGIEEPKKEILGLLDCEKLMVISIVGFGGSGKTALAKAVFDCHAEADAGLRAWHVASKQENGDELLLAILKKLFPREVLLSVPQMQSQLPRLRRRITFEQKTRCLIVIDDIEKHHWEAIKGFFSELRIFRILLTTTVQSVANACTEDRGYIYNMRTLSVKDSTDLLKAKVAKFNSTSPDLANGSAAIVRKCHGHPLALISVANYLQKKSDQITGRVCQDTSSSLCTLIDEHNDENFTKLRQVLVNNYISLPPHLKTCLLYTSLFPNDHPVSKKTLTSRWIAEGYIGNQKAADDKFDQLIDRNIIRPIDTSNRGEKKTFKPHGIMHQFMLYKSISSNFIARSPDRERNFRHIIRENHTNRRVDHGTIPAAGRRNLLSKSVFSCFKPCIGTEEAKYPDKKFLRPRSLTVLGRAEKAVYSDLVNCELLKVLDLKECNNLVGEHIKKIYKLLHLKYLTLGSSVRGLSDKMENLHCLETLDLRKTKIETLPVEVISLPHLLHLFGMIKINKFSSSKRNNFLSRECNLETLSGVVVDRKSQFPELMVHMKQLKKLKIWCRTTSKDRNYKILLDAIGEFAQADMDTLLGVRSLFLDLHDSSKDLLGDLIKNAQAATGTPEGNHSLPLLLSASSEDSGPQGDNTNATLRPAGPTPVLFVLRSLKLNGRPTLFCDFATSVAGLEELCLTYTNLKGADLLAGLRELKCLVYLKLVEVHLENLHMDRVDDLPSLQRLCIVVKQSKFPKIAQGALQNLVSLQLLCKDLVGLCDGINVEYFKDLEEVALDSRVHKKNTIETWENEAKRHPKMPKVVLLKRVKPASPVKYVATDDRSSKALVQGTT